MGWVAYQLKRTRTSTGEPLGDITVIFPKVSVPIELPNKGYKMTTADLINIPDFPFEMTVFGRNVSVEALKNFGFGNAISLDDYKQETWTLDNGSYITISDAEGAFIYFSYYTADGTVVGGDAAQNKGAQARVGLPCCQVGDDAESYYAGNYPWILNFDGSVAKSLTYNQGWFPITADLILPLNFFKNATPIVETDDPYGNGGETEPGGGTGTFDDTGDDVDIPALPTLSAVDTSFITLFSPTLTELKNLANYMWSDLFDVNTFKKLFADPMQAILGLSIVPVNVPVTATKAVKVGNMSTDIYMGVAGSQYVTVDCGTLDIKEFWGAYLDYDPYTKAEIYLPYIGTHPLAVDDIMGKPVHVVYHVDILSGACCAYVKCGGSVLYSFVGQCASSIPITGDNWTNVINGALSIAGSIGSMVATGGASAPMALGQIASTAVNSFKPSVEKSGSLGGTGGLLGVQTPYIILTRPRQALPKKQNEYTGYPSFITENLADMVGYTEVEHIHLENVPATEAELSEIETLLKSGVIF